MEVQQALREAMEEAGWSPAKVAGEAGVVETAARKWLSGAHPGGAPLLVLMRKLPGFAERLGFREAA